MPRGLYCTVNSVVWSSVLSCYVCVLFFLLLVVDSCTGSLLLNKTFVHYNESLYLYSARKCMGCESGIGKQIQLLCLDTTFDHINIIIPSVFAY